MNILSKLVSSGLTAATRNLAVVPVRSAHARVMKVRSTYFGWVRLKDNFHFYFLGIGVFPFMVISFFNNVIFGKCELRDETEDGYAPRYWEYEDSLLKQFAIWVMGAHDMYLHESRCANWYHSQMRTLWRKQRRRAEHLMGERGDYKGWHYNPVKMDWIQYSQYNTRKMQEDFPWFRHVHY